MTINVAIEQLLEVENGEKKEGYTTESTLAVGMARLGQPTQKVRYKCIVQLVYACLSVCLLYVFYWAEENTLLV